MYFFNVTKNFVSYNDAIKANIRCVLHGTHYFVPK